MKPSPLRAGISSNPSIVLDLFYWHLAFSFGISHINTSTVWPLHLLNLSTPAHIQRCCRTFLVQKEGKPRRETPAQSFIHFSLVHAYYFASSRSSEFWRRRQGQEHGLPHRYCSTAAQPGSLACYLLPHIDKAMNHDAIGCAVLQQHPPRLESPTFQLRA